MRDVWSQTIFLRILNPRNFAKFATFFLILNTQIDEHFSLPISRNKSTETAGITVFWVSLCFILFIFYNNVLIHRIDPD